MQTIADLMQAVSRYLCGNDVILRFNEIPFKNKYGIAHKSASGKMVVDMLADLDQETSIKVLLHELAHVQLHSQRFSRSNINKIAPFSITKEKINKDDRMEQEAEMLKKHWLSWAEIHSDKKSGYSWSESILRALLNYPQNGEKIR